MFSKEEFIAIIVRDLEILKHIHSKILPGTENYRPTEKQRSILELVQYLGYSYKAGFDTLMKADGKVFETYREEGNTITIENFPEKINELPKGRKPIITKIVDPVNRPKAYGFIKQQIKAGRQAFFIYPRIENDPTQQTLTNELVTKDTKTIVTEMKSSETKRKKI
jgi:hypothetical protein